MDIELWKHHVYYLVTVSKALICRILGDSWLLSACRSLPNTFHVMATRKVRQCQALIHGACPMFGPSLGHWIIKEHWGSLGLGSPGLESNPSPVVKYVSSKSHSQFFMKRG